MRSVRRISEMERDEGREEEEEELTGRWCLCTRMDEFRCRLSLSHTLSPTAALVR